MRPSLMALLLMMLLCVQMSGADRILLDGSGNPVRYGGRFSADKVLIPEHFTPDAEGMRGVWIATVENLDMPQCKTREEFIADFKNKIAKLKAMGINAVFFQVRPTNDAFYPSRFNPWSRNLTGKEGVGIDGFDPLAFMIGECDAAMIEFHAWLNPYRVTGKTTLGKEAYLATLSPENFARKNPSLVLSAPRSGNESMLFLNPGEPEVRKHIVATVGELLEKYDLDGIHFDDYFYPYNGSGEIDKATFEKYGNGMSLDDWRRDNVNQLIREIHGLTRTAAAQKESNIVFGISPFGIWRNRKNDPTGSLTGGKESYGMIYADSRRWIKEGWIDYIVPQIYWNFGHDVAAYAALVDWWSSEVRGSGVALYIGMAPYRLGEKGWENASELADQFRYNGGRPEVGGAVFFNCRALLNPANPTMRDGLAQLFELFPHE